MWPDQIALLIVEMFGLTGDAVGYTVLGVIMFYAFLIVAIVGIPCAIAERREKGK